MAFDVCLVLPWPGHVQQPDTTVGQERLEEFGEGPWQVQGVALPSTSAEGFLQLLADGPGSRVVSDLCEHKK